MYTKTYNITETSCDFCENRIGWNARHTHYSPWLEKVENGEIFFSCLPCHEEEETN